MAQTSVLGGAIGNYQACFPGAALSAKNPTPANPYCDFGDTQGYSGVLSEENAMVLAFNSLIDPNPANRIAIRAGRAEPDHVRAESGRARAIWLTRLSAIRFSPSTIARASPVSNGRW